MRKQNDGGGGDESLYFTVCIMVSCEQLEEIHTQSLGLYHHVLMSSRRAYPGIHKTLNQKEWLS